VCRRSCPGEAPARPRCGSHVDREIPSVCRPFAGPSACATLPSAFAAHSFRTQYCCPVSGPDCASLGRLCNFAPAAIQASCCSSVSDWLYFREAALRRARQYSCPGARGSRGLVQPRRHCLLPRRYHTQSPQRPLLMAGSRHSPEGAQNGQRRHRPPRRTISVRSAFCPLRFSIPLAFTILLVALVRTAGQPGRPVAVPTPLQPQSGRLTSLFYPTIPRNAILSVVFLRFSTLRPPVASPSCILRKQPETYLRSGMVKGRR